MPNPTNEHPPKSAAHTHSAAKKERTRKCLNGKNYSRDFRAVADAAIARSCINFHSLSPPLPLSVTLCVSLHLFIHSLIYIKCKLIPFVWPELSAAAANEMPSINEPKATQHIRQTESHTHTPHIRLLRNCVSLPLAENRKSHFQMTLTGQQNMHM